MRYALPIVAALLAWTPAAPAVNVAFMPGDAFFHAELTEESLDKFRDSVIGLEYAYPSGTYTFCGFAGYTRLKILGDTRALTGHVKSLFKSRIKQQAGKKYVDAMGFEEDFAGFHLFVYDRSFVCSSESRIGLKYNEDWVSLQNEALGLPAAQRGSARFTTFVSTAGAVAHEWQYAASVPGLPTRVPMGPGWGPAGPVVHGPAEIEVKAVQIVLVPEPDIAKLLQRTPGSEFFSITEDGVVLWGWDERRKLQSKPWPGD
ncbi:hypothetical protein MalM25_31250 [Planctomycetes bacterium MalM25]|nr:hypothetical protein MalM25_31250 [Planctomycetes bacterium MalM25]